ncbi:hypothetical protein ABT160_45810 [Streptomyces sp. NPDC001941]|uniref:hypothetical protein n=1 Tax=Streptomyces sp. NPDC001941 TaxID=3154659 RepID=UPI003323E13B
MRGALAHNLHIDPVRLIALASCGDRTRDSGPQRLRRIRPLPDDILITLLTAKEPAEDGILSTNDLLGKLADSRYNTPSFEASPAGREHPELRICATWRWEKLTPQERAGLLDDPDPAVRKAAREHSWTLDPERVEARLSSYRPRNRAFAYGSCALSPARVKQCFADGWEDQTERDRTDVARDPLQVDIGRESVISSRGAPCRGVVWSWWPGRWPAWRTWCV